MLTVEEAAAILKVPPFRVRKWARDGVLRGKKYGKLWRFDPEELKHPTQQEPTEPTAAR